MCKGINIFPFFFQSFFARKHLPFEPKQRHPLVRNECDESDIVAKHFRSAKSQFLQFLPNFLRIIFQVHYCSISFNSYNFLKNISLKLKSSITFDRKALQPVQKLNCQFKNCKGHFWTDGISKFSENILALPFPPR